VTGDDTCWTLIEGAARGPGEARETFASRYLPSVRAYLRARWRDPSLRQEVDDAAQEVFLDLLREGGALARVDPGRPGGFRAYLRGVVRTVALRVETREARRHARGEWHPPDLDALPADDESLSRTFDREWARTVVREAGFRHEKRARAAGDAAMQRREILRLRFQEGVPIREIAERWGTDPARLHHDYARARAEFLEALVAVVSAYHPGPPGEVRRECEHLLALLG
jgi:RNA polymerase sigma factor (sigma-70 family)